MWLAGAGDVDLSAAEAARTHPGIESTSCSQSPNGMFPNAAGALAPILLDVDFGHLQQQHQAASKGSRRIEEVKLGTVPEPTAVRELVEATGSGPACLRRLARWRVDANPADTERHHRTRASALREHQDCGSAGDYAIRAYSSPAPRLVNLKARMSVSSMRLGGAIDPHWLAAVARTVIGHARGTPRWRCDLATLTAECRRLRQT